MIFSLGAAYQAARAVSPSARRQRHARCEAERAFDRDHNVDTAGLISLAELVIESGNWVYGNPYWATMPEVFHAVMEAAGNVAPGRVFVDLGCGKGRVMLMASEYPFRRIVGVEFAAQLVEVARKNLQSYRNPRQVCRDLEVVLGDAALYAIPDDPLVLFLYSPFGAEVTAKIVEKVRISLEQCQRPVTVIYNGEHDELWGRVSCLRQAASTRNYSIYHSLD